jgi:tetratricopeptide (TPR) repeat protein
MKPSVLSRLPSERDLNRWIRRLAVVLVVGAIAFTAFYVFDRWRPATPPIVDQQLVALEQAVRDDPSDIGSRGALADTYYEKGRYAEAIAQYNAILETDQFTERAHFGRAAAYLATGELDLATQDYLAVVDIAITGEMANVDPTLQAAYYNLGDIAMRQEKTDEAIGYLEKALTINRADADAMYLLATAYTAAGRPDEAVTLLRAAVAFVPTGWSEPYAAMAEAYTAGGKPELAAWAQAMADLSSGNAEAAKPALEALADGPAALDAAVGLGLLNETAGDQVEAATWYQKALELDPENTTARMGLGRVTPGTAATVAPTGGSAQ